MARNSRVDRIDPDATHRKGVPANRFDLTPEERAMLPDPDWVTKDDADAIIAKRRENEGSVSLEEVLRENGIRLER